jgi:hypothetical protein
MNYILVHFSMYIGGFQNLKFIKMKDISRDKILYTFNYSIFNYTLIYFISDAFSAEKLIELKQN